MTKPPANERHQHGTLETAKREISMLSFTEPGTLEVEARDGVARITLLGEHDLATVGALQGEIAKATAADHGVIVSLTDTEFIDSSVTNALFKGDKLLQARGRRLVLHVATASIVRRVLEISGLETGLPNTTSLDEGIVLASARETTA